MTEWRERILIATAAKILSTPVIGPLALVGTGSPSAGVVVSPE
jgi:hypothetical protein